MSRAVLVLGAGAFAMALGSAVAFGGAEGCSSQVVPSAGLMLVMSADDTIPPSSITQLDVEVTSVDGSHIYERTSYTIPSEAQLPTSLAIVSNGNATASVAINVDIWAGGKPIDVRQNQIYEVPADRVAELAIVFSANCTKWAELVDGGAASLCPSGQTCNPASGQCVSDVVSGTDLPTFEPDGGPLEAGGGPSGDTGAPPSCTSGASSCGPAGAGTCCNGSCALEQTDEQNCGSCGHDCAGSTCSAGACQPSAIWADGGSPAAISVWSSNVFWTDPTSAQVLSCPVTGCAGPPALLLTLPFAQAVEVVNGVAFISSYDQNLPASVVSCPATSPGCAATTLSAALPASPFLVTDGVDVYWANEDYDPATDAGGANGQVLTSPAGGSDGGVTALANGQPDLGMLALDATNVYFIVHADTGPSAIDECARTGCGGAPATLASEVAGQIQEIATDGVTMYWVENQVSGTTTVWSLYDCAIASCTPGLLYKWTNIGTSFGSVSAIALDSEAVYLATNGTQGQILEVSLGDGGASGLLASNQNAPNAIALDSKYVYWTNAGNGAVQRVAK